EAHSRLVWPLLPSGRPGPCRRPGLAAAARAWLRLEAVAACHPAQYNSARPLTPGDSTMQPTQLLKREHRVIELVLHCLAQMAERCDWEGKLDGLSAPQALDFCPEFVEQCHHEKEDHHLLPLLEARGLSRERSLTSMLRREHEGVRRHLRAMTEAV